ncbi:hypothetical protein Pint_34908 [Pistacia integerrima]|uniref:Uncharacterized protein n=1 Tax=Pistacia integerrima TaxID=434235 RepID=A0ACC0Y3Q6_9ROSI|nr:hypothetical protein Pint_34908 [Pistacia integerrima]
MRNLLSWFFLIIFFASCFSHVVLVSGQCQSDQQSLLLQLKNSLLFNSTSSVNLAQWDQNTDCCNWSGVDCDEAGHVINLNLSNESISGGIENATGLFALQHLNSLNLAYNRFNAIQIPSRLASLTNLTHLNLSNAGFAGQIPSSISGLTKLVTLDLSSLNFLGSSVLKLENPNLSTFLQNFTEISELYLDGVNISAQGNEWCKALSSSLPNLQVLSLSNCFLSGPISTSLAELRSLAVVRLDQNNLSSTVPGFLAEFINLTSLRLSYCGLLGTFPENIFQVPTLQNLDLSNNELLQGSLPQFPQNLSLRTLMLSSTSFSGTLPDSVGNLKNLSRIGLSDCNFTGQIPASMATLTQIVYLDLSFNNFSGPIPSFHMSKNLTYLDLSHNLFTDAIPSSWEQLQNLSYFDLGSNSLNGSIPSSLFAIPSLQKLQLANNQFRGKVPEFADASSSRLDTLVLSDNRLEGPIPLSIFGLKKLAILLLSSNNFTGTVLLDKIQGLTNLASLDFSYNSLTVNASSSGSFPPQISTLRLASCNLKVIPNLKNQSKLFQLDLSDNQISGEIPNWIWEVGNGDLNSLNLSHNFLVGLQEPYVIPNLIVLDLHSNLLLGKIPLPSPDVIYVDYSNNSFSSILTEIGNSLTFTVFFSLSDNMISGPIPESICNATLLQVLDLSNNSFNGNIPKCLTQSSETLGVLNLRRNNLTGIIFDTFPETCALQTLDLNGNHLQGMVPKSLGSAVVVAPLMFSDKVNQWYDDHIIDKWLMVILPIFGLIYKTSHQRRIEAEEDLEGKKSDEDDDDYDETETQEFRGRYCVFCSKLDFTRKRVVHDLKCTCHDSPPPISSSTSTSSSSSSLAHFDQTICFGTDVVSVSGQCQNDQRSLLIQIKNSLVFDSALSVNLSQWNQNTDCCHWSGVRCDEAGRVISLNLSNKSISGGIENATGLFGSSLENQSLSPSRLKVENPNFSTSHFKVETNLSTFPLKLEIPNSSTFPLKLEIPILKLKISNLSLLIQNFTQLRELYLDAVFFPALSPSSFAKLRSLSVIRLDQNNLSSPVPKVLAEFVNLTSLRLSNCGLRGTFPQNILRLATLEHLDLSNNKFLQGSLPNFPQNQSLRTLMLTFTNFSGILPDSIANLKNLSRIELSNCNFTGAIPTSMANLTQIVYLDLSFNRFTGPIPSFQRSKNLSYLDLSRNQLTGAIPANWEQLQNLVYVDLSLNSLNGSIPPSLFDILSLQKLQLANNQIEGQVPDFQDASSSLLDTLDLSGNRLEGPIPMWIFKLHNLKILLLSYQQVHRAPYVLTQFKGFAILLNWSFPTIACVIPELKNQSKLFILDLSDNQISGKVPNWIWEVGNGVGGLAYLNLSHNLLRGLQEPYNLSNLSVLDLHFNQLQGEIPMPPQSAIYVDYSCNFFTSVPADIGTFPPVTVFFSLSNNSLTGVIPESICNATYLRVLDFSDNRLNGTIPTCLIERFPYLGVLNLRRNNLMGTIPDAFPGNCGLQTLNLNGNQLGGRVPKTLANCKMLEVMDLGNNQITDNFPCWLKEISSFRVLVLRSNKFYGKIGCPETHGNWSMLQIVDLAYNDFGGKLPSYMLNNVEGYDDTVTVTIKGLEMELQKILTIFTSIDLSSNKFEGPIPEEIGQFKSLHLLNISQNALTGPIPSSIGNLGKLESLDLSRNRLSGAIPTQLTSLYFLSVLNLSYNHKSEDSAPASSKELDWQFIVTGTGFGIASAVVVAPLMFSDKGKPMVRRSHDRRIANGDSPDVWVDVQDFSSKKD